MGLKPCPCGCGRELGWSDRRIAHSAGLVVERLPVALRTARCLQQSGSPEEATARTFVEDGVDCAERVLRVAHGDHSTEAKRLMPGDGEGVAWFRVASRLVPSLERMDSEWWQWYQKRGEPPADLEHTNGAWNGEVRGVGEPEPPLPS